MNPKSTTFTEPEMILIPEKKNIHRTSDSVNIVLLGYQNHRTDLKKAIIV